MPDTNISGCVYTSSELSHTHAYLFPITNKILRELGLDTSERRLFDLGCGNGSTANYFTQLGWEVTGVDPSDNGISEAKSRYPELSLHQGSAYEPLDEKFGQFPVVMSFEVVEHVYAPRDYIKTLFNLTQSGGTAVISTPYHGYWKNLAMALTGRLDKHFTVLWDHGHIKFWSIKTLTILMEEAGFTDIEFHRVGRIPILAKSMVAVAKKK